jgi:hypothetical protein
MSSSSSITKCTIIHLVVTYNDSTTTTRCLLEKKSSTLTYSINKSYYQIQKLLEIPKNKISILYRKGDIVTENVRILSTDFKIPIENVQLMEKDTFTYME